MCGMLAEVSINIYILCFCTDVSCLQLTQLSLFLTFPTLSDSVRIPDHEMSIMSVLIGLCFELKKEKSTSSLVGNNNHVPGQCGGGAHCNANDTIYGYAIRVSALVHLLCSERINKDVRTAVTARLASVYRRRTTCSLIAAVAAALPYHWSYSLILSLGSCYWREGFGCDLKEDIELTKHVQGHCWRNSTPFSIKYSRTFLPLIYINYIIYKNNESYDYFPMYNEK